MMESFLFVSRKGVKSFEATSTSSSGRSAHTQQNSWGRIDGWWAQGQKLLDVHQSLERFWQWLKNLRCSTWSWLHISSLSKPAGSVQARGLACDCLQNSLIAWVITLAFTVLFLKKLRLWRASPLRRKSWSWKHSSNCSMANISSCDFILWFHLIFFILWFSSSCDVFILWFLSVIFFILWCLLLISS